MTEKIPLDKTIEKIESALRDANIENLVYVLGDLISRFNGYFFINPADIVYIRHFTTVESCEGIIIITRHGLHLVIRIYFRENVVEDVDVIHI